MESNGAVEQTVDGSTDTVEDAATEEDRLRAEAAKRLERRRRKMMSPEERLARITGRPVSQISPTLESPPPSGENRVKSNSDSTNCILSSDSLGVPASSSRDNLSVATNTLPADDPPLESLRREPRGSVASLQGPEADLLSGLLGTGGDSPLAGLMGAQSQGGAAGEWC